MSFLVMLGVFEAALASIFATLYLQWFRMWTCAPVLLVVGFYICNSAAAFTPCPQGVNISVVYGCLIWPDQNWELLISSQLQSLLGSGLAECATVNVAMSIPNEHAHFTYEELEDMLAAAHHLVRTILPGRRPPHITGSTISQIHENAFEYSGLHLLWLLAQVKSTLKG